MKHAFVINRLPLATTPYAELLGPDWEVTVVTEPPVPSSGRSRERVVEVADLLGSMEVEQLAAEVHERLGIDLVVSMSEHDVLRAARTRDRLGIAGQDFESATAFRDKLDMKRRLAAAGIPVAQFRGVERVDDVLDLVDEVGFPVVVKPRRGAGSVGVEVLESLDDLARLALRNPALVGDSVVDLMAERRIEHEMLHVDGVWSHGHFVLVSASTHGTTTALDFHSGTGLMSVMLDPEDPWTERAETLVREVLQALPTPTTTIFHAELFREGDDLLLNEIACRMGGAKVHRSLRAAFGPSMTELYLGILGGQVDPAVVVPRRQQVGWLVVPPRAGRLAAVARDCPVEGVEELRVGAEPGAVLTAATQSTDALMTAVVVGGSAAEVRDRLVRTRSWFLDGLRIDETQQEVLA